MKRKKLLKELSREDYYLLMKSGMFWEIYPEATGNFEVDVIRCHR